MANTPPMLRGELLTGSPLTPATATTTATATATALWSGNITSVITSNGTSNVTGAEGAEDRPGPLVSLTVPLLMFSTGVLGNLMALLLLWRSRRENARSVFYRLVAGLAVTDLLGTVATSPVTILVYSNDRKWVGGQPLCDYFSFMMIFAGLATVLVVGCMALERFLAILHPYAYERHVAPERVKCVLAGVWVVAALISCLPLLKVGRNVKHYPGTWCFFDFHSDRAVDRVFSFFYASIGLLVIASTAVCNVAVMGVLLRMRRVSQNIGKSREGRTLNMTKEMQMIFFLAGIIFVFATCYSPLMIRVIINQAKTMPVDEGADLLAIRLASLNQILDPWVYLLFRRRLAAVLYSACKTVSPLQNLSSLKAMRSEFGQNSPKNSPALKHHSSANGLYSSARRGLGEGKNDSRASLALNDHSPPDGRCSLAANGRGEEKNGCGTCSLAVVGDSPNGGYSPAGRGLQEGADSAESCLAPNAECFSSSAASELPKDGCTSRTSVVAVRFADRDGLWSVEADKVDVERDFTNVSLQEADASSGHCSLEAGGGADRDGLLSVEANKVDVEKDFTNVSLQEADASSGHCSLEAGAGEGDGKRRNSREGSSRPLTEDCSDGHSCLDVEEPLPGVISGAVSDGNITEPGVKGCPHENERNTCNDILCDNIHSCEDSRNDQNSKTSHNGINAHNGSPVRLDIVGTAGKSSAGEMSSKLTSCTSCPAIYRHGNQTVTKVDHANKDDQENGECLPLLNNQYSHVEKPSNHFKRASWSLNYV